jgi:hypothetical protein
MKRGTIRHPKLLHLARELGIEPYCALGLLEALLDWTFDYARQGNVGRHENAAIAHGIGWTGDPDRLIAALVTTRWLDRCTTHRLVIHDLEDHAAQSWKQVMRNQRLAFNRPTPPALDRDVAAAETQTRITLVAQSLVPPAPAPAPAPAPSISLATLAPVPAPGFDDFWAAYPLHVGKQAARKAWAKLGPSPPLATIREALAWQRELPRWREEGRRYVPHPATYLNGRRWEDEHPPPTALERLATELETA